MRQYSPGDYLFSFISFVGVGVPNFFLALVIMWLAYAKLGLTVAGLFSPEFKNAPWSWARFGDLMAHIWVPMIVLGLGGTAG